MNTAYSLSNRSVSTWTNITAKVVAVSDSGRYLTLLSWASSSKGHADILEVSIL